MPDEYEEETPAHKPLPQCKAFLICERVGVDKVTRQFNLHRIVNSLSFPKFPSESPPLAAYMQLYDGIGQYDLGDRNSYRRPRSGDTVHRCGG